MSTVPRPEDCLLGGGEMGALMRAFDWSRTPLGPVAQWPQSLRTAVSMMLDTRFGMYIAWGPEFIQFYNDGYRPILGSTKHPAIGKSSKETFAEIWPIIGPMFDGVMRGEAVGFEDVMLPLDRHGFAEECYFIFSYSPIREESGRVGGVLVPVTETTGRVLAQRRLATLRDLADAASIAEHVDEAWTRAFAVVAGNPSDLPFAMCYRVDGDRAHLVAARGAEDVPSAAPAEIVLGAGDRWQLADAIAGASPLLLADVRQRFGDLSGGVWPEPPQAALVLPIRRPGTTRPYGVLVAGLSARLLLDDPYREFLSMVAGHIGTGIANAQAREEERRRARALAEIDRAKTAFFSNVSHEFRTPLTLMLGPLQDAIDRAGAESRDDLQIVQRNAQRLLKLVNSLLDFSRIEAGRVRAAYLPTDAAQLTADLASSFRSAIERAGLRLSVDCPPLPEPIYLDRDMWEKIVLNLLSNALKFTFEGEIAVRLDWIGDAARLTVRDTGVGIPAAQLPQVFDRFHRVEGSRARTQEGTGIGLALVQELVRLHGGEVSVESEPGRGTTFTITIPAGRDHLPAEQVSADAAGSSTAVEPAIFVDEASRWLPGEEAAVPSSLEPAATIPTSTAGEVVVADDNADMRDYLRRILSPHWHVTVVADGMAALAAARERRPDLLLTDVMMPGLDGFALLQALRGDPATRAIRVVMLSARAGEEARVEGLQAGADDYLVKPFSARELVARLEAQFLRARIETVEGELRRRLAQIFTHAPVGIAILRGPTHIFEFANAPYLELVRGHDIVGRAVRDALPELDGQGIYELLDTVYRTGRPYIGRSVRLVIQRDHPAADECFFDFVYQPTVDDQGRVDGIAVVVFEVTELAQARRAADVANRAKDEFLAMLGHELRNPLAPIFTALQLIRLRGADTVEKECQVIERQVRHLMTLVDDLLDVARITRGKIALRRSRVELADVVAKAIEFATPLLEQNRHQLRIDVPRGIVIDGDAERLSQVAGNLVANAAKYTNPGGTVTVTGRQEDGAAVLLVQDTGIGIAAEMLPHIFDLFVQDSQAIDRARGGLGLGLAIVRSLVQQHGGTVTAHSKGPGLGSTFVVTLPLASTAAAESASETLVPLHDGGAGIRVMVVDDNYDAAQMLAEALKICGYTVAAAYDGVAALTLARTFRPDIALLDLGLPVVDGYELAAQLSRDPALAGLRLIAVTGYGQDADRVRTTAAGFVTHLVKPVDLDELLRVVEQVRQRAS